MKVLVAISGASGSIYAIRFISSLTLCPIVTHIAVVMSNNAKDIMRQEIGFDVLSGHKIVVYNQNDFSAPFASGSNCYDAMIIIPCSMGMLARVASGVSDSLMTRSADVFLKERRKIVFVCRETPYSLVHIKNMEIVTLAGGIVCPACPSFYSNPKTIDELVDTVVARVLDLIGIDSGGFRWGQL